MTFNASSTTPCRSRRCKRSSAPAARRPPTSREPWRRSRVHQPDRACCTPSASRRAPGRPSRQGIPHHVAHRCSMSPSRARSVRHWLRRTEGRLSRLTCRAATSTRSQRQRDPRARRAQRTTLARSTQPREGLAVGGRRCLGKLRHHDAYLSSPTPARPERSTPLPACPPGVPVAQPGAQRTRRAALRHSDGGSRHRRPKLIKAPLRAWAAMFGRPANSTDLSVTHARRSASKDGGERLRRLKDGWSEGRWPPASVVQYHYGTIANANRTALAEPVQAGSSD